MNTEYVCRLYIITLRLFSSEDFCFSLYKIVQIIWLGDEASSEEERERGRKILDCGSREAENGFEKTATDWEK